jgi:DUF1365 family protein
VRDTVEAASGVRPEGPIRVLTQLRSWGHCFNPASFYYCLDPGTERVQALVAEVTNTPWGERHAYVVTGGRRVISGEFDKALHVSPFMTMDHRYTCRAAPPGSTLALHIESRRGGEPAFDATLALRRVELTDPAAARLARRYPLATVRVLALIYLHGVRLRLAGVAKHPHPARGSA